MGLMNRLRNNRSLAIGAAGGLISLAGGVLTALSFFWNAIPKGFGILLAVLTLLALIPSLVAIFLRPRGEKGERYIPYQKAAELVALAVKARNADICRHIAVRHATGVAVLGIAARQCYHATSKLFSLLDAAIGELRREHSYTEQAIVTHIRILEKLRNRISGAERSLAAKQCFDFREGQEFQQALIMAGEVVQVKGITPLMTLLRGSPQDAIYDREHPTYKTTIETALRRDVPDALDKLKTNALSPAGRALSNMIDAIEGDWDDDASQVAKDEVCKRN